VLQSLFLAAIGDARDRGVKAIETFGFRYPEGETSYERVLVHRTVFPADFLADFGFTALRWQGDVCLARLELGGLVPVEEADRPAWRRSRRPSPGAGAPAALAWPLALEAPCACGSMFKRSPVGFRSTLTACELSCGCWPTSGPSS
jgi:hypothetical protein